jgi:hypothetical protein
VEAVPFLPYQSKSTETRATNRYILNWLLLNLIRLCFITHNIKRFRAVEALPSSPRKRQKIVLNLAHRYLSPTLQAPPPTVLRSRFDYVFKKELVTDFYHRDDVSRCSPGLRDCKSVIVDNLTVDQQIRHLLCSLKESYNFLLVENGKLVSFSKFAKWRPEYIFTANKMPHNVCVCRIHENFIWWVKIFRSVTCN